MCQNGNGNGNGNDQIPAAPQNQQGDLNPDELPFDPEDNLRDAYESVDPDDENMITED